MFKFIHNFDDEWGRPTPKCWYCGKPQNLCGGHF